jgi:flagellar protein FliS
MTANAYAQNGPAAQNAQAYLRTRVLTASPEELRMMLLDGAAKFARQARESLARRDFEGQYTGTNNCRNIVFELMTTIREDVDPDLATNVKALYAFLYKTITEASFEKDLAKYDKIIELLDYERETWAMLMKQVATQKVAPQRHASGDEAPPVGTAGPGAPATAGARAPLSLHG